MINKFKIKHVVIYINVILFLILSSNCQNIEQSDSISNEGHDYQFPYDINDPDKRYKLPDYLSEISGLSYYKKKKIVCIQDEKALIYIYDMKDKEVKKRYDFGKDGDFEGIEIVDKVVYIVKSNGELYRVKDFTKDDYKTKKIETGLKTKNDVEGLAYDSVSNSLLIACKGDPEIKKSQNFKNKKAVYRFDLNKKELIDTPFLFIDLNLILNPDSLNAYQKFSHKVASEIDDSGDIRFQPSGIAINPITKNIYIIASVGNRLLVFHPSGEMLISIPLSRKIFSQPEGICFDHDGNLFISNEGRGGRGNILKFKYR